MYDIIIADVTSALENGDINDICIGEYCPFFNMDSEPCRGCSEQ